MAQVLIEGGEVRNAKHNEFRGFVNVQTLTGTTVLQKDSPMVQFLDPGGAARNVDLPAEADSEGLVFIIVNTADAAEIITVRDDGGGTIATPTQNEMCMVACSGAVWRGMVGSA